MRFRDRPTGELLVFMIAGTVCFSVVASGVLVALIVLLYPETDVTGWVTRTTSIINTMIGVLAGFLAGKTDNKVKEMDQTPEPPQGPPGA